MVISDSFKDSEGKILRGARLQEAKELIKHEPLMEIVERDKDAYEKLTSFAKGIQAFKQQILAEAESRLTNVRMPTIDMPHGSLVAPLVCESMLWKLRQLGIRVDLAIQNAGGQRSELAKGSISVADVYTLLPFKNTLVTFDLSGREIKNILEDAISSILDGHGSDGAYPYVGGLKYRVTNINNPGHRIDLIKIQLNNNSWQDLKMNKTYKVVTNSYLAKGKNGYKSFGKNSTNQDTGLIDADVFMDYLRFKKILSPLDSKISYN